MEPLHKTRFYEIHQPNTQEVVNEILKTWPSGPGENETPPLLMLCNNDDLDQQAFLHFIKRFLMSVVIDMYQVRSIEAVVALLGKALERRLPVIIDIPPSSGPDLSRIAQAASSFNRLSVLFSGSKGAVNEQQFDLVFSPRWLQLGADMPLVAAMLAEKIGYINFTSHLELMTVQTARRLIATGQQPTTTLDLHSSVQPLFDKLLSNCKAHIQTNWPALALTLSFKRKDFLMGCLMECFEKRPDRILSLWQGCPQDAYNKLCYERDGAEFAKDTLTQGSRQENILQRQTRWSFDDKRTATRLSTGKLSSIATIAPNASTLPGFWEFVSRNKPGIIVSLSSDGALISQGATINNIYGFILHSDITRNGQTYPHLYHLNWEDGGVIPSDQLYKCIKLVEEASKGRPPLVHCLAGLGRTGTFIAAYEIYLRYQAGDFTPDILSIALSMNMQRHGMVQTWEQFKSLFQFLVHLKKESKNIH